MRSTSKPSPDALSGAGGADFVPLALVVATGCPGPRPRTRGKASRANEAGNEGADSARSELPAQRRWLVESRDAIGAKEQDALQGKPRKIIGGGP